MVEEFYAGAAKVDITPIDISGVYLAGFDSNRKADHVIDPLYARALYLRDGKNEFALVVFDLIGLMYPEAMRLRESAGVMDPKDIWIACTHTHSGPDTIGLWGPSVGAFPLDTGADKSYFSFLVKETGNLIQRAKRLARPATLAFASDASEKDSHTWNVQNRKLMDHRFNVMTVVRKDGKGVIACLSNFGSHPEALWENNTGISPDWVAPMHKAVERKLGGISLFANGALGAMVTPGIDESASIKKRMTFYKSYGKTLADIALNAAKNAQIAKSPRIRVKETRMTIPLKNDMMNFVNNLGILHRPKDYRGILSTVAVAQIGPAKFIATPGEAQPAFGLAVKKLVGGNPSFLISLCNDELGYLLPRQYYSDNNYEYEQTVSPGPEAEEKLLDSYRKLL